MRASLAVILRCPPSRWSDVVATLWALTLMGVSPVATLAAPTSSSGSLGVSATPETRASRLSLSYSSTNADAGSPARYGLIFPVGAQSLQAGAQSWTLLFDAEFDVPAYRRRVRFCYGTDRAGRWPMHSRCVESIPAEISVSVGPGQDRITVVTQESLDPKRAFGVWVDLINPSQAGLYVIQLVPQSPVRDGETTRTMGAWSIRIEPRGFDSPGSDE